MSVNIDQWLRNEVLPELKKNGVYIQLIEVDSSTVDLSDGYPKILIN